MSLHQLPLELDGVGLSKKEAELYAANRAVEELACIMPELSVRKEASFELPPTPPTTPPLTPPAVQQKSLQLDSTLTTKQKQVLLRAQPHLDILRATASKRGVFGEPAVFLALDIEAWERNHTKMLEVGIAIISTTDIFSGECHHRSHWIVEENNTRRNGRYVADQKNNFLFGTSSVQPQACIVEEVYDLLRRLCSKGQVFLFGHSVQHDLEWLGERGKALEQMVTVCDIAQADQAKRRDPARRSLQKMLQAHHVESKALHNAGNDAAYTLECALVMMGCEDEARIEEDLALDTECL